MKRNGIINSKISNVLSQLGHTDKIVICDAGLPIPDSCRRIDISLRKGYPSFIDVFNEILKDMVVESLILAQEIKIKNNNIHKKIIDLMPKTPITYVNHNDFKVMTKMAKAIIRTGEVSPYSNVILQSGVFF